MSPDFDSSFIDASNWQVLSWYNSGGTRTKRVLQDDHGNLWYFKCSARKAATDLKPEKYFKYEFWSEVIAYQLGNSLGLDVLRYDAAVHDNEMGCISPLMIDQEKEQLVEIGRYMTVLNPGFNPADRKTHAEYSFEFLIETLEHFNQTEYLDVFLKTMLFDALIGNSDRHQENWAFITHSTVLTTALDTVKKEVKEKGFEQMSRFFRWGFGFMFNREKRELNEEGKIIHLRSQSIVKMAPIYDSGSSMGRELNENR
jgi:HipA-like C-terminal domain